MRRRILIILGIALLIVVSVPTAVVYYLAYTQPGLQWVVNHVPRRIGRTQLEIVGARGTLARGFTLERFESEHERAHLRFEGVVGHITLLPLLWQTIHADDVTMRSAYVEVRRWKNPPPKSTPRFLPRGLIIQADKVHVDAGTLIAQNGRRFDVTDVTRRRRSLSHHSSLRRHLRAGRDSRLRQGHAARAGRWGSTRTRILVSYQNQPSGSSPPRGAGISTSSASQRSSRHPSRQFRRQRRDLTSGWHWAGQAR
jgi:autotransporter translocation and assembly factor TamB